ncbi:apolipoprotein N-acyltransferase [Lichenicola cladoniae]|uniref:Apolipoprotein N-acyltransferase n=1 Tax=Lichenicola cladoniae TaxID=1484109 RepID=A0A6M8HL61_9PROT|nr:apolipoprotein N-acyltransferase [Lichenicola cladoniae]NPD69266.1 apolipoprotein N-acyltransferase [Acetobacteraceae bacterium]QKE89083.1 apolipoprotein N-acyltransferase [Lichenicola cladoniae]
MRRFRNDGLAVLLGAISALALPPSHLVFVLLLTVPMLLRLVGRARNWKVALRYGFVFGMGLHTAGLYWLTDAVLVRADEFWWLVPLAAPLGAVPLACFTALPCAFARLVPEGWRRVVLFAAVWTLSDLGRQFVLSGFPWNLWGSIWEFPGLAGDVMIQPAAWISIHGLTLFTLLLAATPVLGRRGMLAGLAMLLVWVAAGSARLIWPPAVGAPGPWVVLVQGNVPETDKQNQDAALGIYRRYVALTQSGVADAAARQKQAEAHGAAARPIVFAWPESAFPGLLERDRTAREVLMQAAPDAAVGLIGSVRYGSDQRPRNSLIAVMPDARVGAVFDKAHLVPFGEYQPPFLPVQIVPGGGFEAGPGVRSLNLPGLAPIGPLICYEVIFPGQVVQASDRPAWLLNITNDAWYGNTSGPRQHLAAARMRAVEEGLPLARAANTGISGAFDGQGRPLARLGWGIAGSLVVALPGPLPPTVFARFGLPIPLLLCLLCVLVALAPSVRRLHRTITISK